MKKYAMLIDVDKCTQCYNCVLACKDEHYGSDFPTITEGCRELDQHWIDLGIQERGERDKVTVSCWPELCLHCEEPGCAEGAGAAYRRGDGIVILDPVKAKGKKELVDLCPEGAISWNDEKGAAQKCTMCAHLLDAGEAEPRCVEACPTSCMKFGDLNDPESEVSKIAASNPELQEQTGIVRYYGRPTRVVTGSVYLSGTEVAEGVNVRLLDGSKVIAESVTNGFGDFKFERVPEGRAVTVETGRAGAPAQIQECPADKDFAVLEFVLG